MTARHEPRSFVRTVDRVAGAPLTWVVGRERPERPRRRGDGPRSVIDSALGEALAWFGLTASRGGRHGRR